MSLFCYRIKASCGQTFYVVASSPQSAIAAYEREHYSASESVCKLKDLEVLDGFGIAATPADGEEAKK